MNKTDVAFALKAKATDFRKAWKSERRKIERRAQEGGHSLLLDLSSEGHEPSEEFGDLVLGVASGDLDPYHIHLGVAKEREKISLPPAPMERVWYTLLQWEGSHRNAGVCLHLSKVQAGLAELRLEQSGQPTNRCRAWQLLEEAEEYLLHAGAILDQARAWSMDQNPEQPRWLLQHPYLPRHRRGTVTEAP